VSRLEALALLGWMRRDEALGFLQDDCVFRVPLATAQAEELWLEHRGRVEALPADDGHPTNILPMSEADIKATRKFRASHPNDKSIVDIVRLNPMELVIHRHWVSPSLTELYGATAAPAKWNQTSLLDPPAPRAQKLIRHGNTFTFNLPHADFLLTHRPGPDSLLELTGPKAIVTVTFYGGRALLLTGYHRTYALACHLNTMQNAPRGVLFAVSDDSGVTGNYSDYLEAAMTAARPARIEDFFNTDLCVPLEIRKRKYQLRVNYEISNQDATESDASSAD
jgi:hypothetical protein